MESAYFKTIAKIESRADVPAREASYRRFIEASRRLNIEYSPAIVIAGTNGKGTVAKMLEGVFTARGENVGLFTSPHLIKTTERIRSANTDLSEDEFVRTFELIESLHNTCSLSHFETLTLMMLEVFFGGRIRPRVDRAILEIGVGGKWDPVSVVKHEVSVITKLGFDHEAILGTSLLEIAEHKFGIVEDGNLVVHAPLAPELEASARQTQRRTGSRWVSAAPLSYSVRPGTLRESPRWIIPGVGELQALGVRAVENASIALKVVEEMKLDGTSVRTAIANTKWPGRMEEFVYRDRPVYISGDHNSDGARSLAEILAAFEYGVVYLVIGIGKNKSVSAILDEFLKISRARLVLTNTPFRSAGLKAYGEYRTRAVAEFELPEEALDFAVRTANERDLVVVTGSLYLVGELRPKLLK